MKQWKRILSLVLVVSLVFSMGIVLPEVKADSSPTPTETTWDFTDSTGWTLGNGYTNTDGKLVWQPGLNSTAGAHGTAYNQYNGAMTKLSDTAAASWGNYSISADITATYNGSVRADTGANLNQFAMVGIGFYVSGTDYIQIRVRPGNMVNAYSVTIYENNTSTVLFNNSVTVSEDTTVDKTVRSFNLKAEVTTEGQLTVYINDVQVAQVAVSTPAVGAPALYSWVSATTATEQDTITFDNVKVAPLAVPVVAPTPDHEGTLLGWSDGSADLSSDWTVTGAYAAEGGVLKATTADDFFAKVGFAAQHGYIEADITLPAKADFTATANTALGYINATVGTNQVFTLRLFWQQTSKSTTLHDGKLYADLFVDDTPEGVDQTSTNAHYGGAAQGTRISYTMADADWGKTYTLRLSRIGNFLRAELVDKATAATLKVWEYSLNPAYTITTGAMTLGFGANTKDSGCTVAFDNVIAAEVEANTVSAEDVEMTVDAYKELTKGLDDAAQVVDVFYRTAYAPGETVSITLGNLGVVDTDTLRYTTATDTAGTKLTATAEASVFTFAMPNEAATVVCEEKTYYFKDILWDFEEGYPAEFPANAAYAVAEGKLVWTSTNGATITSTNAADYAMWSGYKVSVDVKVIRSAYTAANAGYAEAVLILNSTSTSGVQVRVRPFNTDNKYSVKIYEGGNNIHSVNAIPEGGTGEIADDGSVSFKLSAAIVGGKLTVWIDDIVVAQDIDVTSAAGAVGLRAHRTTTNAANTATENIEFDNLTIDFPEPELDYAATLVDSNDGSAALKEDIWSKKSANTLEVQDGVLYAAGAIDYRTTAAYANGFIEADITLTEGVMEGMTANGTKYGGNLSARWTSSPTSEVRSRFKITKDVAAGTYTAELQLVTYSSADFGGTPSTATYIIPDFAWGTAYNVRLVVLGNTFRVFLDGEEVICRAVAGDTTLASYAGGNFGLSNPSDSISVAFDNLIVASAEPNAVEFDSIIGTNATVQGAALINKPSEDEPRTAFAPGETVTVSFTGTTGLDLTTLRYTTASNTEGVALTATEDEKVFTFLMPDEAVTVTCDQTAVPANTLLYDMAATPDVNMASGWRADATTVAGKGILVKDYTVGNAFVNYYNTGVQSGWIEADITLPAIPEAALQTNSASSGDIWYGLRMARGDGTGIDANKYVDAAIWYQRNTGTTKDNPKTGTTYLRVRFAGTGYTDTNLVQVTLPNSIWSTGATVHMELRKVDNYIVYSISCATVPEANLTACCTVDFAKLAGGEEGTWKFGLRVDNPLLYTDWTLATQVQAEAYYNNIEVGQITRTVDVTVDSASADYVSLPAVNELGTSTPLDRTCYEVGEVLELVLADGANVADLKYTTASNTEGVAIADASAFAVPDETALTLVYTPSSGPVVPPASSQVATADGSAALDTDIWAITGNPTVADGVITSTGSGTVLTKLAYQHASIVAEITLPATHSLTANATVASVVARINATQEHVARFQWSNSSQNLQIGMLVRDEVNMSNTTTNPHYGGGANGISRSVNHNEAWGKTYIVELIRIGNLIDVTFTDKQTNTVVEHWSFNLNPVYEVTTTPMYFGFTTGIAGVVIDNVVVTSYDAHGVDMGALQASVDENAEIATGLDGSGLEYFSRTHYAAGETVSVMINDTTGLDLTTLRYTTLTDPAGTVLTATAIPGIYTFEMPQEDVVLVCDEVVISDSSEVLATVDGSSNLDPDLWTVTGDYVANGTINTTAASFVATLDGTYQDFSLVAEITLPTKPTDLTANVTLAALKATVNSNQSYTARFFWQNSNSTFSFDLFLDDSINGLVVGDGIHNYGGAAHGNRVVTALTDADWGKTYTVTLRRIGNNLYVSAVDTQTSAVIAEKEFNLNPAYTVTTSPVALSFLANGSHGAIAFDNLVATSYTSCAVSKGELDVSLDQLKEISKGLETGATLDTFDRTAYVAGETVTVTVNDASDLDLSTLRYTTVSNPTGVLLTATANATVFTFVMPNQDVTLVCDEGSGIPVVPKPEGEVFKTNFDSFTNGTSATNALSDLDITSGGSNASVQNGALKITGAFGAASSTTHQHGYVQADITLVEPQASMENATAAVTKYGANLSAKWKPTAGDAKEVRTRFMVKRTPGAAQEYTVQLQMVVYAEADYGANKPITHSYDISNIFNWGETYNVKLQVIGNFIQVYLDGALVMSYVVETDNCLVEYAGKFGMAHTSDSFVVTMDNLDMHEYKAYKVSFASGSEDALSTDIYRVQATGKNARRTHFQEDEFVRLNVTAPVGYGVDEATLKYTGAVCGEVSITAKDSDILYGFRMPAEDVEVSTSLTPVTAETKPVKDDFDVEALMRDRGWSSEKMILDGAARLYGSTDTYLSGIAGSGEWYSYTVSAKITYLGNTSSSTGAAAICVGTTSTSSGYEFGITVGAGGALGSVRLYDRGNAKMLYQEKTPLLELGTGYTLTLVVNGGQLTGYVNGAWKFTVNTGNEGGGVGIRTNSASAAFDDISVTNIVAK